MLTPFCAAVDNLAYLTGGCDFSERCWHVHPADAAEEFRIRCVLKRRPCTNPAPCAFGPRCLFDCRGGGG